MLIKNSDERRSQNKEEADRLAQETLDRMKARSDQRKADISETVSNWTLSGFLTAFSVIVSLVLVAGGIIAVNNASAERSQMLSDIDRLQKDVDALNAQYEENAKDDGAQIDSDIVIGTLNSAVELGKKVEDGENEYRVLYQNFVKDTTNSEALDKYGQHAEDMEEYFTDSSARVSWYDCKDLDYTWSFRTTYDFQGESVPVIWTCYDADNELLAYTTAVYNVASNKFSKVDKTITRKGAEYKNANAD